MKHSIVILYGPPWDQPAKLSKHQFALLWSKESKVLYVESPPNTLSFLTRTKEAFRLLKRFIKGPVEVEKRLWVTTYFYILPFRGKKYLLGGEWVNALNQYIIKRVFTKQIKDLGLVKPIFIVGDAHAHPLLKTIDKKSIIYHCSDDYTLVPSYPESFPELEKKFIKECTLVVTTAEELKKAKQVYNSNTIAIPNGANIEHFFQTQDDKIRIANDIVSLRKPIVGYIGSVFRWLNLEWIEYAAKNNQDCTFVFIGPITIDISKIKREKNIIFLGPRNYNDLPSYLKGFDIATIPFTIDGVTLKASPIKFYEYLASGVPIISTDLPDLKDFRHLVSLVQTKEEFSNSISYEIENNSQEKIKDRMNIAKNFSWQARFDALNEAINRDI